MLRWIGSFAVVVLVACASLLIRRPSETQTAMARSTVEMAYQGAQRQDWEGLRQADGIQLPISRQLRDLDSEYGRVLSFRIVDEKRGTFPPYTAKLDVRRERAQTVEDVVVQAGHNDSSSRDFADIERITATVR